MAAKCRRRRGTKGERWEVYLYWQGRKWRRYSYTDGVPLTSQFLADRLCHAINAEIERLGPGFSPKAWFKPNGHELRFDNYAKAWLERRSQELAPATEACWHGIIETYLIPVFGTLDIRSIKRGHLEDYLHRMPAEFAPKTRQIHLAVVRAILGNAYYREDIQQIPPFPTVRVPTNEIRWLSPEEWESVLSCITETHRPIFEFMGFYGVRPGEARALKWDAVDMGKKVIFIRRTFSGSILRETTKTSVARELPIMPGIEELLQGIRGIGGFVFRTERGQPYPHCRLTRVWRRALAGAKLPHIDLYHGIRHSSAMSKLLAGWDMENLQTLLGHTSARMTRRYARATVESLRKRFGG